MAEHSIKGEISDYIGRGKEKSSDKRTGATKNKVMSPGAPGGDGGRTI